MEARSAETVCDSVRQPARRELKSKLIHISATHPSTLCSFSDTQAALSNSRCERWLIIGAGYVPICDALGRRAFDWCRSEVALEFPRGADFRN
jgi:hypothetical protein